MTNDPFISLLDVKRMVPQYSQPDLVGSQKVTNSKDPPLQVLRLPILLIGTSCSFLALLHDSSDLVVDDFISYGLPDGVNFHSIGERPGDVAFFAVDGVEFLEYHPNDLERELMKLGHGVANDNIMMRDE